MEFQGRAESNTEGGCPICPETVEDPQEETLRSVAAIINCGIAHLGSLGVFWCMHE